MRDILRMAVAFAAGGISLMASFLVYVFVTEMRGRR